MQIFKSIISALRAAATHNPDAQSPPGCILWPDGDRPWESVIARLQSEIPELFQLGDYLPGKKFGPAIWLRCVMAGTADLRCLPADSLGVKPKIKREKDRSTEPNRTKEDFPCFWDCDENTTDFRGVREFKGERFNDCYYTLTRKRRAGSLQ